MLKAGALYYAIVIALLIGVLSAMLILFTKYYFIETTYYRTQERLMQNSKSGLELLKSSTIDGSYIAGQNVDLYDNGTDSVYLKKIPWGVYGMSVSKAFHAPYSFTEIAMNGYYPTKDYAQIALYLTDHDVPLGYCGKSRITGSVRLPKSGSKLNLIERRSFEGRIFINGEVLKSDKIMPKLNSKRLQQIDDQRSNINQSLDTLINCVSGQTSYERSFANTTARIDMGYASTLSDVSLSGNIKVSAPKNIVIDNTAHLKNVLIMASRVEINEGFLGSVQIVATDTVIIHSNVRLYYPSSIVVKAKGGASVNAGFVKIEKQSVVQGEVYLINTTDKAQGLILIDERAKVQGLIYDNGRLTLRGKVEGTVICDKFYLNTASAIYDNQILDGVIDRAILNPSFLFSDLFMDNIKEGFILDYHE